MSKEHFDVVLLAGRGPGPEAALAKLVAEGVKLLVVNVNTNGDTKPGDIAAVHTSSRLENLCREYGVVSRSIKRRDELVTVLVNTRAALALSNCYPWRLPTGFLSERFERSLNIHPSRLPAWRGPDPVFWQLRAGASRIPVTVHEIANRIDRGQPVAFGEVDTDTCVTESDLDIAIAQLGVDLSLNSAGRLPLPPPEIEPGVESRGLWHRSPTPGDYRVFPTWTVVHASRFMRLMGERHIPFRWSPPGSHAIEFSPMTGESGQKGGDVSINLADGAIRVLMKNSVDLIA